jgi:cell division protein FtsB
VKKKNRGTAVISDGRYIFNEKVFVDPQSQTPGYAVKSEKRTTQRKHSTFNIVIALFGIAIISLLYTGNLIAVNHLAKEVNDLNEKYKKISSTNEILKAEVNRKSTLDRIQKIVIEDIGLVNPKEAPVWFSVDNEKLEELQKKHTHTR